MENYISANILFILKKKNLAQDEFGANFQLGKGVINQYLLKKSQPKIDTIIKICDYYKFTLDDFIRRPLTDSHFDVTGKKVQAFEESLEPYIISPRYVELLEQQNKIFESALKDKDKIIHSLEEKLIIHDKSKTA